LVAALGLFRLDMIADAFANFAMASRVPLSRKLTAPESVTTLSILPCRMASTTGPVFSNEMSRPLESTAFAVDGIGWRESTASVTCCMLPTSKFHLSLASTKPQSKSRVMMKARVMPLLYSASMVQSRNLPSSSLLASPFQLPDLKAEACPQTISTATASPENQRRLLCNITPSHHPGSAI